MSPLETLLCHCCYAVINNALRSKEYNCFCICMLCHECCDGRIIRVYFYELGPFPGSRDICQVFGSGDPPQSSGISQGPLKVVPGPGPRSVRNFYPGPAE